MTQDMKGRPRSKPGSPKKGSGGSMWLGLLLGLVIGVGLAFGVIWYTNKALLHTPEKPGGKEKEAGKEKREGNPAVALMPSGKPGTPPPGAQPGQPADLQFYDMLSGKKEPMPTGTAKPTPTVSPSPTPAKSEAKAEAPESNSRAMIQTGSFQDASDADNMKAKLTLLGYNATVQTVDLGDKGTFHRVKIGPLTGDEEVNRVREELKQQGITAVKIIKQNP